MKPSRAVRTSFSILAFMTAMAAGLTAGLTGCQAVFTYSPFTFLQRDFSDLSTEQKVTHAREVLETGETTEIAAAYEAVDALINPEDPDPELSVLAADLAFGASGVTEVLSGVLEDPEALVSGDPTELEALINELDLELVQEGAEHIRNAAADTEVGTTIDDSQYALTGATMVMVAAEEAGGFENLADLSPGDAGYDTYQDAEVFLELGNVSDLMGLLSS